jgi:fructose 1,6-bisphosphate aldolase/phosphatase
MKVTLSVIKADVGGFPGHSSVHPDVLLTAEDLLEEAREDGKIFDYYVGHVGDDMILVMTHDKFI